MSLDEKKVWIVLINGTLKTGPDHAQTGQDWTRKQFGIKLRRDRNIHQLLIVACRRKNFDYETYDIGGIQKWDHSLKSWKETDLSDGDLVRDMDRCRIIVKRKKGDNSDLAELEVSEHKIKLGGLAPSLNV